MSSAPRTLALGLALTLAAATLAADPAPSPSPCKEWTVAKTQTSTRGGAGALATVTDGGEPIGAVLSSTALTGAETWYVVTRRCTKQ